MKVGFLQFKPELGEIEKNCEKIKSLLKNCKANLIVLPELCTTGYMIPDKMHAQKWSEKAETSMLFNMLSELTNGSINTIAAGFAELGNDGKVYNSAMIVHNGKLECVYRKIHLFDCEFNIFEPGNNKPAVLELDGIKYGIMICFDWIFPETTRSLALMGSQVILHCANLVLPFCQDAMITRSIENRVFTITSNRIGTEQDLNGKSLTFTGKSQVTSPKGERLISALVKTEELQLIDINPEAALNKNVTENNHLFNDRRPDKYFF